MTEEKTYLVENQKDGERTGQRVDTVKGIVAAFVIVILFACSATAVQLLERRIPDMELNTFRSAGPFLTCAILTVVSKQCPLIGRDEILATVLYTVDIFISALFFFVAISLLPAALVSCVSYTSSVVSALFVFSLCWNEKITLRNVMFALISVLGVVMVIQPWQPNSDGMETVPTDGDVTNLSFLVNGSSSPEQNVYVPTDLPTNLTELTIHNEDVNLRNNTNTLSPSGGTTDIDSNSSFGLAIGYSFSIISGITLTLELLIIKRNPFLSDQHLFWAFLTNTLLSAILMLALETPVLPSNWFDGVMVIIHSVECAVLWRLYIYAPKHISGNTLTLILTSDVVVMLIFQYTVLSSIHPGHRNWIEVVGVILVLFGCSVSSFLELLNTKKSET